MAPPKQTKPFHERPSHDSLGFLGHVRRVRAEKPLSPEVFNSSHLIEAYLDFLKVGSLLLVCPKAHAPQFRVWMDLLLIFILTGAKCESLLKIILGMALCVHAFLLVQMCRVALDPEAKLNVWCLF